MLSTSALENTSLMVAELRQLMIGHGFLYAIMVVRGGGVTEIGEKGALEHPYIADNFLRLSPQEFFESLEDQILPRLWGQGRVSAFIHKPTSDLIVGLFSHSDDDALAQYELAEQVDRELTLLTAGS